ncbi:RNA polymerase sigma-70 factor (ECF subfamily) [Chitinophaga niastensis]|uniref:RNA polymerase sigma-70 factor (ECF subfamily) n=1 Tax=Chitinophaga niastensis TaxID=536980 RepID=A0A2P8HDM4_CHINA|nr:sigma-70 family RNA polymerase sigma factor [Chitinophaga niastensis]PSL44335.1 RNA polymerase sigma-70 factor (ECF subfamily) [Chitinophaga niastensis]
MNASFTISKLTDQLFRHEAGKMVALLTKIFGTENLDISEDVVQDTFINAMQVWPLKGVPDNPSGWLFRVAKNKAIDVLRRNKFSRQIDFNDPERTLLQSEYTLTAAVEKLWRDDEIQDDLLRMMFACCHPDIAEENQITLILKTLCGFSTSEIAKAFLTSEDTVSKRLYRTKNFFREKKIKPEFPAPAQLKYSIEAVLKAIYLIFNEGYNATHANDLIRKDLLDQAMYLCKLLAENANTRLPEVFAAMALMCFHSSRINGRINEQGEIVLLAQQDRSKWNRQLIEEGNAFMNKAAYGDVISSYHIEAAIAYEHCIAETFEQTNWQNILAYYDMLVAVHPNAVVMLHRLTVIYKVFGAAKTLEEMDAAVYKKDWEKNYLYYALLGDIYAKTAPERSKEYYQIAFNMTQSSAEKNLLQKKMNDRGGI